MSKAVEIINALVSPANKLIDAVTRAIGKAYQPHHIRKMAEAKVYEINMVGQALRDNADVPIVYNKGELSLNTTDFDEFVKRTQSRLAYQELQKQQNIENVANKAYELLENETECSSKLVSQDWMTRFFNSVGDISDEDMQTLWAKILAGEIKQPKSYSLRTLETLKNLSKEEAELFQKISPLILIGEDHLFMMSNPKIYEKHNISYEDIMSMGECGLLVYNDTLSLTLTLEHGEVGEFYTKTQTMHITGISNDKVEISFRIHSLTNAGKEIFYMLNCRPNDSYMFDFAENIFNDNKNKVNISIQENNLNNQILKEWKQ